MNSLLLASTAAAAIAFGAAFAGAQQQQPDKAHHGMPSGQPETSMTRQQPLNAGGAGQGRESQGFSSRMNQGHSAATGNERGASELRRPGGLRSSQLQSRHGQRNATRQQQNMSGPSASSQPPQSQSAQTPNESRNAQTRGERFNGTAQPRGAQTSRGREFHEGRNFEQQERFRGEGRFGFRTGPAGIHWTARPGLSISVGAGVPRGERLFALPPTLATRFPQFRGFRYIAFRDRIAIVQPRTNRVVTVLPAASLGIGVGVGSSIAPRGALVLSVQERERISARIRSVSLRPGFAFTVGATVPAGVQLLPVPSQVVAAAPQLRGFRFVSECGKFAIVDPHTMRIVAVLPG